MIYEIRKATVSDLSAIWDLVQELAVYEKEEEALTADLLEYEKNFEAGNFDALVATTGGQVVGMMVFYYGFSTWKGKMLFLEDFVVTESYRRKGLGKLLFDELLEIAKTTNVRRLKWQVLDWNLPALNFYRKYDSEVEAGWLNANLYF